MKCPSCREALAEPGPRCPHCGLTLHKLDLKFGVAPKHFGAMTDRTLALPKPELRKLHILLELFQRKFPQSVFSVFLTEMPAGTALGEYTFWLANRVRFNTVEANGGKNFDLLLVVDVGGAAGLTVGYGLENMLAEGELSAALEAGRAAFAEKNWTLGIERTVSFLMARMREIAQTGKAE